MRANLTFDTLEYAEELKKSGMKQEQAEAITKANTKAFAQMMDIHQLANKRDIMEIEVKIIKSINENTWKIIGILATFQTIIIGAFGIIQYLVKI